MNSSVQFSRSVLMDCMQHARPPCPSPTPGVCSNSCPLSQWCHPTISSSVIPFSSCSQSFRPNVPIRLGQIWRRKWQPTPVFLLENPMNRGGWQAMVRRVAESRTRLKWLSTHVPVRLTLERKKGTKIRSFKVLWRSNRPGMLMGQLCWVSPLWQPSASPSWWVEALCLEHESEATSYQGRREFCDQLALSATGDASELRHSSWF